MKYVFLFFINLILTIVFRDSFVSLITGTLGVSCAIFFIFVLLENLKQDSTIKTEERSNSSFSITNEELRRFALKANFELTKEDIEANRQEFFNIYHRDNSNDTLQKIISTTAHEKNTTDYDLMGGAQFENFCADILAKNGFANIIVTQHSGDHGVDILAEKDDITYAIQCKCYSGNVGNDAIMQVNFGKTFYKRDIAVVLTNQYFTPQAKEEAAVSGVKLWDRDKLDELIQNINN